MGGEKELANIITNELNKSHRTIQQVFMRVMVNMEKTPTGIAMQGMKQV